MTQENYNGSLIGYALGKPACYEAPLNGEAKDFPKVTKKIVIDRKAEMIMAGLVTGMPTSRLAKLADAFA